MHILLPKTNAGNYTYDGIELGGERVTHEIETFLHEAKDRGTAVTKISVVGYSLGGLVARYAIGLLDSRGWFNQLEPVNFTTFASPHLGVRTPVVGMQSHLWNFLGSHTLSVSGQQLFTTDKFRDTGRPLLSLLADPSSIFMIALSKFKNRVLYANIVNDRSAPYYTTSICNTDPFNDLDSLSLNYLRDYEPTILDPAKPVTRHQQDEHLPLLTRLKDSGSSMLQNAPIAALFAVLIPIFTVPFIINAGIQSVRSQKRIRLHEEGKSGISLASYRIPLMIENVRGTMEDAFDDFAPATRTRSRSQSGRKLLSEEDGSKSSNGYTSSSTKSNDPNYYASTLKQLPTSLSPPLALSQEQIDMIAALDNCGFKKYRVHITQVRHSHAAIIVRVVSRKAFSEGKVVVRHWLNEEFEI